MILVVHNIETLIAVCRTLIAIHVETKSLTIIKAWRLIRILIAVIHAVNIHCGGTVAVIILPKFCAGIMGAAIFPGGVIGIFKPGNRGITI